MKFIHTAAHTGDAEAIRACLAAGVPVDQRNEPGDTALMIACRSSAADIGILKLLLAAGADPHAFTEGTWSRPLIVEVVPEISREKFQFLLDCGIDPDARGQDNRTAFLKATDTDRQDLMEVLLDKGASPDHLDRDGFCVLKSLALRGRFTRLAWLLNQGADPAPLKWTPLHRAVAVGSADEVLMLIVRGADLEKKDWIGLTPFMLAVMGGDCEKATLLLEEGANPEPGEASALHYAVRNDQTEMLQWLLDGGCDPERVDRKNRNALKEAIEWEAEGCCRILLEIEDRKKPSYDDYDLLMKEDPSPAIIRMLVERGANPGWLEWLDACRYVGLQPLNFMQVTREEFVSGHFPRFGTSNPERVDIPFWNAMVRCGWSYSGAAREFPDVPLEDKAMVWSYDRLGMSLTPLPDGRFIQIGGVHEVDGDRNSGVFYNDVIIHDGKGDFQILAYPGEDFPPTAFHTATFVDPWIYIIGNGNTNFEEPMEETPVYRLHTQSGVIEKLTAYCESPGWVHGHHTLPEKDGKLRITGAALMVAREDGIEVAQEVPGEYLFDPVTGFWRQVETPGA